MDTVAFSMFSFYQMKKSDHFINDPYLFEVLKLASLFHSFVLSDVMCRSSVSDCD